MAATIVGDARTMAMLYLGAAGLKLLLQPAYHSTDFEVHRNWMAVTSSLPLREWYFDETSEWTLDYPPLFAWLERLLAVGAGYVEPAMLTLSATPYASSATVAYQRSTVIAMDIVLLVGATSLAAATARWAPPSLSRIRIIPAALAFLDAGLLLVDHVHFQARARVQ
eukprot:scaffold4191_cov95-Isochrysis_galbana.AAC.1